MTAATPGTVRHRALAYPVLPVLRASNGAGLIHPDDRKYGSLLVGGQGSGKTAAMLRTYLNDIRDSTAAVVVLDPKSELSRLCLQLTPPEPPKRVWFLDLGHPAFGMSPLRLRAAEPLPLQATAIAENIVAALLDIKRKPDLPILPALPLPRRHRRARARRQTPPPRPLRRRLPTPAARQIRRAHRRL